MSNDDLGTLNWVKDLRSVWPNEASDFTPWLIEHIDQLGKALDMDLEVQEREAAVGDFSVDIHARDLSQNRLVIIENQLESTDHDHLGKLFTYASGLDAHVIIWIAKEFRPEHRQAIDWINQHTDTELDFFGITLELLQISESRKAVHFRITASPNEWQKNTRNKTPSKSASGRNVKYRDFFQALIDELREKYNYTNAKLAQLQSWYAFSSGSSQVKFSAVFAKNQQARAEVYIDGGDSDENKSLFDYLVLHKDAIEAESGISFEWDRLDDKRACRIASSRNGSILSDSQTLEDIRIFFIDQLVKIRKVFPLHIQAWQASKTDSQTKS